ncbi:DUF2076 family protein [Pseudonocardia sp. ICBG162]|uniref:DUF2076 domain-containing protein n=1 Tax=Pseudonocardia sp. ICBG162 TaxID=2846761 RepID=UPI001CF6B84D|nr:DUF2076 family protein [Pseudonocardia sp. ICBG162]
MDATDRQLITDLADRVRAASTGERDPEAAALIDRSFGDPRSAVYVLTQAVLVQEQALAAAQARVAELEAQQAPTGGERGGFMSGLFGRRTEQPAPPQPWGAQQPAPQAWANHPGAAAAPQPAAPAGGGGSFMRTAAGVAAGVAGGALLATGVSSMLSEPPTTHDQSAAPAESGATEDDDWGW